jgi:hypothetical protein
LVARQDERSPRRTCSNRREFSRSRFKADGVRANAPPARPAGVRVPLSRFPSPPKWRMERREAPGRCATAPLHAPCDRGVYAPHEQACETCSEARASRSDEFARLAARTLRLPALQCDLLVGGRIRLAVGSRHDSDSRTHQMPINVRADLRAGITYFRAATLQTINPASSSRNPIPRAASADARAKPPRSARCPSRAYPAS